MTELEIRKAICEVGVRLYDKNMVAATDGNISVRLTPERFLVTPSGVCKGDMKPNDILITDAKGNKLAGDGKVTTEFFTHLAAYEERPDITSVVHAHPPKAIGFTLAGVSLAECVLPEVVMALGGIPTSSYATPASMEGSQVIRDLITQSDAVLIDKHGAVTVGATVWDAYFKMEKVEHAAETIFVARMLGNVPTLSRKEIEKISEARERYGVSGVAYRCVTEDGSPCQAAAEAKVDPKLQRIVEDTIKALGHR